METTAVMAKKYGLKPHFFIQSMAFGGVRYWWNDRTPTEEDLRQQIYAYLAHGAKGFSHFCYQTPTTDEFYERQSGLFDKGAPTERWFYAQKIHGEIKSFEKELLSLSWECCLRVDGLEDRKSETDGLKADGTKAVGVFRRESGDAFDGFSLVESVEANARLLAGGFKGEDGKEGYMLVNVEDTSRGVEVVATLTLKKPTRFKVYKKGVPTVETFDKTATFTLGVGEGIFVIGE
jgi:hypothetical protein